MAEEARRRENKSVTGGVLVIGSANVDVSVSTPRLPLAGETVLGDSSLVSGGGKGANQALAAARCGAETRFMGRVGEDAFGQLVREALVAAGVDTTALEAVPGAATGLAAICVDGEGQNCIVVVPGANLTLRPEDIEARASLLRSAAVVVLQCEIPLETVYRSVEIAAAAGTPVILNPAPCGELDLARLPRGVTYLIPNETEAAALAGRTASDTAGMLAVARQLHHGGVDCVILTRGERGCLIVDEREPRFVEALAVTAIDATGAGDAFVGCLAASLVQGYGRDEAVRRAVVYASLSTTRRGAQRSYPSATDLEREWARARAGKRD